MSDSRAIVKWLFETGAVRICPSDKPFWYTSGKIGPYYINTHFLYGGEKKAGSLLALIDTALDSPLLCSGAVLAACADNYEHDEIYAGVIDTLVDTIMQRVGNEKIDYISGGERRDWFFSLMVAKLLDKPHITIFKNLSLLEFYHGESRKVTTLEGANVLHIADLITEASSYQRAWLPALKAIGGNMLWSLVVVDRLQGGADLLRENGVESITLTGIDAPFFEEANKAGLISDSQLRLSLDYMADPVASMKRFIFSHPDFISHALHSDAKTIERAQICLSEDFYGVAELYKKS